MSTAGPPLVAVVGPTATGKSALGLALAARLGGEIVSCDSTAVYRGFDIGTDKVPPALRGGVPHHLVDVAEPTEVYSAARYARDASAAVRQITARGRLPVLVGGTGLYYRALTRGLFPGPGRDAALRARLERIAARRGLPALHRLLARVDPISAARIPVNDLKRLVRALEVYRLTGRTLSEHFADTRSLLEGYRIFGIGLILAAPAVARRVERRVDAQFEAGLVHEVRSLLARGVPGTAHPFSGLVYRQVLEMLQGERDEAATRALIAQENRRYARRQLIWFRKEPNLRWFERAGEEPQTADLVEAALVAWLEGPGPAARGEPRR